MSRTTAHEFSLDLLDGSTLPLSRYAGHPVLVVNTASKCGFTPQYEELQAVWSHYRGRGLVVIGTPCNDFGKQEPGTAEEIGNFCARNYGVSFPMSAKLHVRGPQAHPLFDWLGTQGGMLSRPRWNFYKYLIGRDGGLQSWFTSVTKPMNHRVRTAIDRAILRD